VATTLAPELNTTLPASSPALLVEHVTKRFTVDRRKPPVLTVDDVSLRLERGAIHGILGANGSGKSTLILLVSGLRTPVLDGTPVTALMYDIVPLIVMGIVLIPTGVWAFGRAERYAKRTGKLKRVG
jgi:ABC-type glutathione transport system ATPase component